MTKRNSGNILNVSSAASFSSGPLMSTYYATKGYVTKLTLAIYEELRRINSRIQKINSYYNKPTELISRFIEMYYTDYDKARSIAPKCTSKLDETINNNKIPELKEIKNII